MNTLTDLCTYYPHDVKIIHNNDGIIRSITSINENTVTAHPAKHGFKYMAIEEPSIGEDSFKMILRPMNLHLPITVDGKEIIPIVTLAKIAFPDLTFENWLYGGRAISRYNNTHIDLYFFKEDYSFKAREVTKPIHVSNQLQLFQWLTKHKFDYKDLIGQGKAISTETLETNIY